MFIPVEENLIRVFTSSKENRVAVFPRLSADSLLIPFHR